MSKSRNPLTTVAIGPKDWNAWDAQEYDRRLNEEIANHHKKMMEDRQRQELERMYLSIREQEIMSPKRDNYWDESGVMLRPKAVTSEGNLLKMLASRFHVECISDLPFDKIRPTYWEDKVVVVAFNKGHEPVMLADEWSLFPSDTLMTQLRLVAKDTK